MIAIVGLCDIEFVMIGIDWIVDFDAVWFEVLFFQLFRFNSLMSIALIGSSCLISDN